MLRRLITRFASAGHAPRAAAVLLVVAVTLSCATQPETSGMDLTPSVPGEMEVPRSDASPAPEMTAELPAPKEEIVESRPAAPALPASEPTPSPEAVMAARIETQIDDLLQRMTIEQKVGQRFMTWIPGTASSERVAALIGAHVGGVILIERNVESYGQMRELIDDLQRMAQAARPSVPLFIATDQEGGRVSRVLLPEMTHFPAAHHQGAHADPDYVEAAAYVTGVELRRLGVNMNLGLVVDLYGQLDETVIGDRSFGADAGLVADLARGYVRGADRAGIIPVAKHFPGHGVTTVNSHELLPVVRLTRSERSSILAPFSAAIDAGVDVIMTAHILYEDLDSERPASVSPAITTGLLREQLDFDGVVITDAIEIGEPAPSLQESAVVRNGFAAGADIILAGRESDVLPLVQEAIRLVRSGLESEERLNESVRRILRVKLAATIDEMPVLTAGAFVSAPARAADGAAAETNAGPETSAGTTAVVPGAPAAPVGLTATGGDRTITLAWADPGDSGITSYEFQVRTGRESDWRRWRPIARSDAETTSHALTGLTNGAGYQVRIRARNAAGVGYASEASATPQPAASGA